ncbi:MAG: glycerol-3-phosphate 1-O-acyltransferase PlsY [Planctomycetes bacterium]|nr:glycerol-3-phosphate 1-O-acyltransferase PlsY [Planctomycetota bacterium]
MNWYWLLVPVSYLIGSVSFAYIAGRMKGIDLREHGSRNLGATNAGRVLGKKWFLLVFLCDLGKGVACVLAARWLCNDVGWLPLACGAAVILGHTFTCYHGFKGGKAIATSEGVLAALVYQIALTILAVWLIVYAIGYLVFRAGAANSVGPASICAAAAVPFAAFAMQRDPLAMPSLPITVFCCLLSALVLYKHRSNIMKLVRHH